MQTTTSWLPKVFAMLMPSGWDWEVAQKRKVQYHFDFRGIEKEQEQVVEGLAGVRGMPWCCVAVKHSRCIVSDHQNLAEMLDCHIGLGYFSN